MARFPFDPDRHPSDVVSQSSARITTGRRLTENFEDATAKGYPADVHFITSVAIARVLQLEEELRIAAPRHAQVIQLHQQKRRPDLRPVGA